MKRARPGNKIRKTLRGSSRGFTLIEVVIAIALIGLIGVAVLSAMSTATLALITADQRATAESLARSQWEYVKSQNYTSAPNGGVANYTKIDITAFPGYSIWSVNRDDETVNGLSNEPVLAVPWDSGNNTAVDEDNGLQRIKLVIMHDSEILVTLEDYKRNPEV